MDISATTLFAECDRFLASYPWVWSVDSAYGLPRGTLLAVGSRETNLSNEVGDGGHGFGVWQLDNRSHTIPADFMTNVYEQATTAAGMLRDLIAHFGGNLDLAFDAYNEGVGGATQYGDAGTTGGDYGRDVLGRLQAIQGHYPPPAPLSGGLMSAVAYDPISGGTWTVREDGAVYTADGAPYLGGLNQHPNWGAGTSSNPVVGISFWKGDGTNAHGNGYVIVTKDSQDTTGDPYRYYRWSRVGQVD